MHIEFAKMI